MLPMLVHHCSACNYNTPVAFSASIFSQDQYCNHCGAVSQGVVLRIPAIENNLSRKLEEEPRDMQQDELSRLFAQNLTFTPAPNPTPPPESEPLAPQEEPKRASSEPITYITQHYHHSAHIASPPARNASPPHLDRSELEQVLLRNSINPSILFPSQLTLFQTADTDQRLRLLELWRICPPTYAEHERIWESGEWPETSLQQEEAMARARYEHMMAERQHGHGRLEDAMMDANDAPQVFPVSPTLASAPRVAEPYMLSGYEALARRDYDEQARAQTMMQEGMALQETTRYNQSTDPAYFKPAGLLKDSAETQDMENQYGAFQAMRQSDGHQAMDEDMVM